MKDKRIILIAGAMVALCTAVLFAAVFFAQEARAQQPLAAAPEQEALPAVWVEAAEEPETLAEAPANALPIGGTHMPAKELKAEEIVFGNWIEAEPGPADISEEQAVENAIMVAETLFDIKKPTLESVTFYKDMTGQRGNFWDVEFVDDGLGMSVDALTGNVFYVWSERYSRSKECGDEELSAIGDAILQNTDGAADEYFTATQKLAENHLRDSVKDMVLNAVHGDGAHHPAVSISIELGGGECYDVEWIRDGQSGKLMLYRIAAYPDRDHIMSGAGWYADMLWQNAQAQKLLLEEGAPAMEPTPTPQPPDKLTLGYRIATAAKHAIGKPYMSGESGPDAFDDAGLIYHCLSANSIDVPRTDCEGYATLKGYERIEDMDDLELGDVLFFEIHVSDSRTAWHGGIYMGDGEMVDASSAADKVVQRRIRTDYWERYFSHALRFE